MKSTLLFIAGTLAASAALADIGAARAADSVNAAKAAAFDKRMFAGPIGDKASACFVHRYDVGHLAQHPRQKVSAMKLLVTTEKPSDENTHNYSFHVGIKYRNRPGDFDASGFCNHTVAENNGQEIRFGCAIDCEGGGLNVGLAKDDKSAIVRLQRIVVWERNKFNEEASDTELSGGDDKMFRLERTDLRECDELVTESADVASLGQE